MTLLQLQYFITIAEMEHFTRAAEKLMVSQSSLSHSIKELEEELGVRLFMRQGRNVKLTRHGEMFLPYVIQSLSFLQDGKEKLEADINPNTGTIAIVTQPSLSDFVSYITVRYISETGRTNVSFKISQVDSYAEVCSRITGHRVDFALSTVIQDSQVSHLAIGHHQLVLIVSGDHPLSGRSSVNLEAIDGEKFIPYDHTCQLRDVIDGVLRELNVHPRMSFETAQDHMIYALVAAGQGVSIVPRPLGALPYNIRVLEIENEELHPRNICLSWNTQELLSPACDRFREFIQSHGSVFDEYLRALSARADQ